MLMFVPIVIVTFTHVIPIARYVIRDSAHVSSIIHY